MVPVSMGAGTGRDNPHDDVVGPEFLVEST